MSGRLRALPLAIATLPLLVFIAFYSQLPASVAMQWGVNGEPTWHAPKLVLGAALLIEPLAAAFIFSPRYAARVTKGRSPAVVFAIFAILSAVMIFTAFANLPKG